MDITTTFVEIFDSVQASIVPTTYGGIVTNIPTGVNYGLAGEAITAGQLVYQGRNNFFYLASALDSGKVKAAGVALASVQWPGMSFGMAVSGDLALGASLTIGAVYIVSGNNRGGIAPCGDFANGWFPGIVGLAVTPGILRLGLASGIGQNLQIQLSLPLLF